MRNKKIFPQKEIPYLEFYIIFLDELETFGKLEAKKWAHIPHVQTQAAFELSDEAFQVRYKYVFTCNCGKFITIFRQNIW